MKNPKALDSGFRPKDINCSSIGLPSHQRTRILDLTGIQSTRAMAEAMRTAILCDICRDTFATGDPQQRLCDDCRAHVFAKEVPWPAGYSERGAKQSTGREASRL